MSHIAAVRAHQIRHGGVRYIVVAGIEGIFDAPGKHAKAKFYFVDLGAVPGKTDKPGMRPKKSAHDNRRVAFGVHGDIKRLNAVREFAQAIQDGIDLSQFARTNRPAVCESKKHQQQLAVIAPIADRGSMVIDKPEGAIDLAAGRIDGLALHGSRPPQTSP
jgi:hypothetical protein